jgi:hypothetical protein
LPSYSPPLISIDNCSWGVFQTKGNATAHLKWALWSKTIWQLQAAKVWRCCSKIAVHTCRAWRRPSPLVAATIISFQATVPAHHLKPFSGLRVMKQQNYWA